MWPFSSGPSKEKLSGVKTVRLDGANYRIRRLNPLLDFDSSSMPQIFSTYQVRRKKTDEPTQQEAAKALKDMFAVVAAGLVEPRLVPVGKDDLKGQEDGITVDDIFRDPALGIKLYCEIVAHSLNRFSGIRGVFFSARIRLQLYTAWQRSLDSVLATSSSAQESSV